MQESIISKVNVAGDDVLGQCWGGVPEEDFFLVNVALVEVIGWTLVFQ